MRIKHKILSLCTLMAGTVLAHPAQAVVVFLSSDSPVAVQDGYSYTYQGNFSDDEGLQNASRLIIFDFAGYVADSISALDPNFTPSIEMTSSGVPIFNFTDDPNIPNLVFTYTGALADLSNQAFTGLSAVSTFGSTILDGFGGLTVKLGGLGGNTNVGSAGLVAVPTDTGEPTPVPEPAMLGLMAAGLGMMGIALRARRRKGAA